MELVLVQPTYVPCVLCRLIERAADKSSRLLPYEDAVGYLENLYEVINEDGEVHNELKAGVRLQITALQKSLQVRIFPHSEGSAETKRRQLLKNLFVSEYINKNMSAAYYCVYCRGYTDLHQP